jgi:hypothetical protein
MKILVQAQAVRPLPLIHTTGITHAQPFMVERSPRDRRRAFANEGTGDSVGIQKGSDRETDDGPAAST